MGAGCCVDVSEMILPVRFIHSLEVQPINSNLGTMITSGQLIKGPGDRETRLGRSLAGEGSDSSGLLKTVKHLELSNEPKVSVKEG